MKKILYIIAAALVAAVSCQKDGDRVLEQISGEWHYSATESGVAEDVYVAFSEDGTFEMYQKIGDGPYWYSAGEYTLDAKSMVLSGVYSDRYPWKYTYKISVNDKTLTMKAVEQDGYSITYAREAIPSQVRQMSLPLTKSESVGFVRFL